MLLIFLSSKANGADIVLNLLNIGVIEFEFEQSVLQFALDTDHVEGSYVMTTAEALPLSFWAVEEMFLQALQVVQMLMLALDLDGGSEGVRRDFI